MKSFIKVGDFRFDRDLIKGWLPMEQTLNMATMDEPVVVRNLHVLYDCFQLSIPDEDGKLLRWLDDNFDARSRENRSADGNDPDGDPPRQRRSIFNKD